MFSSLKSKSSYSSSKLILISFLKNMSKFRTVIRSLIIRAIKRSYWEQQMVYQQKPATNVRLSQLSAVTFIAALIKSNSGQITPKTHFDAEIKISKLIQQAEEYIINGQLKEAKKALKDAMDLADNNHAYGSLSYLCDLFSSIVLSEGDFNEAENILVKLTEKLLQLGYPETHNSIVTFKLKLARIYQILESQEMAEYGFRDCIRTQEKKLEDQKQLDDESNGIYLTALYWYGKLLTDQKDWKRAMKHYKLCWERVLKTKSVLPPQKMVILHSMANVSAILKDFDEALYYLYGAIEICLLDDPNNKDLPIFIVQIGLIYLQKKIYESALFWCQTGHDLAMHEGNELAKNEGQKCLQELKKLKII